MCKLIAALLGFVALLSSSLPVFALDLSEIPRTIEKEPKYQEAPRYCLFVFGPKAQTRVWVVLDGKIAYVDRNGNGDLTESSERLNSNSGTSFRLGDILQNDGAKHTRLYVSVYKDDRFRASVQTAKHGRQMAGWGKSTYVKPRLAKRPQQAPIIHFNGPLTIARYGPASFLPRKTEGHSVRLTSLRLLIGSPGV